VRTLIYLPGFGVRAPLALRKDRRWALVSVLAGLVAGGEMCIR
jgi:hypothetical protein